MTIVKRVNEGEKVNELRPKIIIDTMKSGDKPKFSNESRRAVHHLIFQDWVNENRKLRKRVTQLDKRGQVIMKQIKKVRDLSIRDKGQLVGDGISSKEIKHLT